MTPSDTAGVSHPAQGQQHCLGLEVMKLKSIAFCELACVAQNEFNFTPAKLGP